MEQLKKDSQKSGQEACVVCPLYKKKKGRPNQWKPRDKVDLKRILFKSKKN